MNDEKRITKWEHPTKKMESSYKECPECHTIGYQPHDYGCSKPRMIVHYCNTTQFGPCNFGEWLNHLQKQMKEKGIETRIIKDDSGCIALFEA